MAANHGNGENNGELQSHSIDSTKIGRWTHTPNGPDNMYQNEHNAFFASIRNGEARNDGEYMCDSTLMAIMGRLSAYTGKALTWDEVRDAQISLVPDSLKWGPIATRPIARPGETAFA
jgi:myo-inositol 2-dehydrogenase/D-chiro-inositol 1-dehydrogenase